MASGEKAPGTPNGAPTLAAPSVSLPKGGGAIRGIGEKFAANPVTGTGSVSVPLATSAGRFSPQLSLSYDSGSGNGPFGLGWSLSTAAISRKTDKGRPQYRDAEESDVYILSGAEDLVPTLQPDGTRFRDDLTAPGYVIHCYRPRIEGLFARIERWTNVATGEIHWRSISPDNVTTLYGQDNNSRIIDPSDASPTTPTRVFTWLICQSYDDKGNAIVYEYALENDNNVDRSQANERNRVRTAQRYLKRIKYGNRVSRLIQPDLTQALWMFEVVFDYDEGHYEDVDLDAARPEAEQHRFVRASPLGGTSWSVRPDPFSSHRAGFEVRTYRRCHRVLMFHHIPDLPTGENGYDGLVASAEFDYADLDYGQPVGIEGELAHQGSTRFASFIRAITRAGYVRDDTQPVVPLNGVEYATYLKKSLPPLEFEYSKAVIQDQVVQLKDGSLENLPAGLDGSTYQWVDLDGEGVSGILTEQASAWFYKPNLGDGRFGPLHTVVSKPSLADLTSGHQQLIDVAGDGQLDLVTLAGPTPGFYERTYEESWETFRPFRELPNIPWDEPNLRFVDVDGDGHPDVLITELDVFTWHQSLAEEGFGPAQRVQQPLDEERGPRLVMEDGTQSIYLADMCGDGYADIVRIRNGEVCYWSNQGGCRYSGKVTMDNAPWFDNPDQFDQRRVRLADIDGSGTNDIIYLGRDGARLYFNQSGNRLSGARRLVQFPQVDHLSAVMTADLLGNGTACLVWSSPLPGHVRGPLHYIDLMGGTKPHLLTKSINNLGAETELHYVPSTRFYLADKREGRPWVSRLPFPVHVVERVVTCDRISGNQFVARYAYHHGCFDGIEREFRGFGLVEQWDTEEFAALNPGAQAPSGTNSDASSHVPPVFTRTWFHTGVFIGRNHVSDFYAGLLDATDTGEYYREPGLTDAQARTLLLDDTVLPNALTVDEEREACRALKGSMLRQEVYALDGTGTADYPYGHPYTVSEQSFTIRVLQRRGENRHAVFFTHACESITSHYEREPTDPRVGHALTLEVDTFGNVLQSAAIGYGRRQPNSALSPADQAKQTEILITYTENRVTNDIDAADDHRTPVLCESRTYELTGLTLPAGSNRFTFNAVLQAATTANPIDYEASPTPGALQKRLIEHVRSYYRRDDLTGALVLGDLQPRALPFESYKLAFTPGLVAEAYGGRVSGTMLEDEGRYMHTEGEATWWLPGGRVFYSPTPNDPPSQELAHAREHFFLPHRYRDAFHTDSVSTESFVTYDVHDLLVQDTRDALGNRITVGERNVDPTQPPVQLRHDYRVLQPALIMDANRNRSEVAFDALGMVVGTAVMGKPEDVPVFGDHLASTFRADLTQAEIDQFVESPKGAMATALLDEATTRLIYDLSAYWREPDPKKKPPVVTAAVARETHASEPVPPGGLRLQTSLSYSDGFGREIQKKIEAEPGPVPVRNASGKVIVDADGQPQMTANDVSPRWVGSGWTVFNNKGKPVRQYEPFFTDIHHFEFDVRIGVSPVLFYDPVERVVATLHPDHTWEKVVFDPWHQTTYDVSDTVLNADGSTDPRFDEDVTRFFARLPDTEYLPTWYEQRVALAADHPERIAADKAAVHRQTPTVAHLDTLGRIFITIAHNRFARNNSVVDEKYPTRVELDIEGNQRNVRDAVVQNGDSLGRIVMRYTYDMLGNRVHQASMEAGERWMLNDVSGKPVFAWDSRDFTRRVRYDELRRPTALFVAPKGGEPRLAERTVYGESEGTATNHRMRVFQVFDAAGVVTSHEYDFKGNLLRSSRGMLPDYKVEVDWQQTSAPNGSPFTSSTTYDALNRPTAVTAPDTSVYRPTYNEANLLEKVEVSLRGATLPTPFVTDIDYNAKGQRAHIQYANGVETRYEYDVQTFRLIHLRTTRSPGQNGLASQIFKSAGTVQDLRYTYDPAGNITRIADDAIATIFYNDEQVDPVCDFTYDAIDRLIEASGREHIGQTAFAVDPPNGNRRDQPFMGLNAHPNDSQAMRRYAQHYEYDAVGNFAFLRHVANGGSWTRQYEYAAPSLIEPPKKSNRLTQTHVGNGANFLETYTYADAQGNDVHGCMTAMNSMPLTWDFKDQLQTVDLGGGGTAYYVYDSGGHRVRKVIETQNGALSEERIYLGGFEVFRKIGANALVRETLHVMDDKQRIALVETKTQESGIEIPNPESLIRYQFSNQLGSASVELGADSSLISYEEYHPYGTTAYQAMSGAAEVSLKRYRYTGKERDEETGFHYHGARYYVSSLGRWTAPDPASIVDGPNLYGYSRNNPVNVSDPSGTLGLSNEYFDEAAKDADAQRMADYDAQLAQDTPAFKTENAVDVGAGVAKAALKRAPIVQAGTRVVELVGAAKESVEYGTMVPLVEASPLGKLAKAYETLEQAFEKKGTLGVLEELAPFRDVVPSVERAADAAASGDFQGSAEAATTAVQGVLDTALMAQAVTKRLDFRRLAADERGGGPLTPGTPAAPTAPTSAPVAPTPAPAAPSATGPTAAVRPDVRLHEVFRSPVRGPREGSSSRGYNRRSNVHQEMLERGRRNWGGPGPAPALEDLDLGHAGTNHARLRPGQAGTLKAQPKGENRSIGASEERAVIDDFREKSQQLGLDPHDPSNPFYTRRPVQ